LAKILWDIGYSCWKITRKGKQVTLLTRSGPFVIKGLPAGVDVAGEALMKELIRRATETEAGRGEVAG
jgi:hypothetical protein